jgi:hypothetical protein
MLLNTRHALAVAMYALLLLVACTIIFQAHFLVLQHSSVLNNMAVELLRDYSTC